MDKELSQEEIIINTWDKLSKDEIENKLANLLFKLESGMKIKTIRKFQYGETRIYPKDTIFTIVDINMSRLFVKIVCDKDGKTSELLPQVLCVFKEFFVVDDKIFGLDEEEVKMTKIELYIRGLRSGDTVTFRKPYKEDNFNIKAGSKATVIILTNDSRFLDLKLQGEGPNTFSLSIGKAQRYLKYPKSNNINLDAPDEDVKNAIINGNKLIVELETGFKGIATCDEYCEFNNVIGYMIAYNKAKKKEANYNCRVDRTFQESIIRGAQESIALIDKNYKKQEKQYDYNIKKAMSQITEKPKPKAPF